MRGGETEERRPQDDEVAIREYSSWILHMLLWN
jgi:hypothetical protein